MTVATEETPPSGFDNGLSDEDRDALADISIELVRLSLRIDELGKHRSYSIAVTKIDEARHWLRDRTFRSE